MCTHPTLFQDPEIDGELEGQREVRGREHHWAAGTRSKLSPGDQEPPCDQLTGGGGVFREVTHGSGVKHKEMHPQESHPPWERDPVPGSGMNPGRE